MAVEQDALDETTTLNRTGDWALDATAAFPLIWSRRVHDVLHIDVDTEAMEEQRVESQRAMLAVAERVSPGVQVYGLPVPYAAALSLSAFPLRLGHARLPRNHVVKEMALAARDYAIHGWPPASTGDGMRRQRDTPTASPRVKSRSTSWTTPSSSRPGGRVCTDWLIGSRPSTSRRLSPHSTAHPQPFLARDECSTWAVFVRVWSFAVCGSARGRWAAGPVAGDEAGTEVDHLWPTFWDNCLQPWQWPP
jgi:hypothetical protein